MMTSRYKSAAPMSENHLWVVQPRLGFLNFVSATLYSLLGAWPMGAFTLDCGSSLTESPKYRFSCLMTRAAITARAKDLHKSLGALEEMKVVFHDLFSTVAPFHLCSNLLGPVSGGRSQISCHGVSFPSGSFGISQGYIGGHMPCS